MVVDPLSVAVVTGAAGYLMGRGKKKKELKRQLEESQNKITQLEADNARSVEYNNLTINVLNASQTVSSAPYADGGYGTYGGYTAGRYADGTYAGGGYVEGGHDYGNMEYLDEGEDNEVPEGNLVCDICDEAFPKHYTHYHCIRCHDGDFDICQSCRNLSYSCPGGHQLYQRRLALEETEADDGNIECNKCGKEFPKHHAHYNCIICNDGLFNICQVCKDRRYSCPGGHELYKRRL